MPKFQHLIDKVNSNPKTRVLKWIYQSDFMKGKNRSKDQIKTYHSSSKNAFLQGVAFLELTKGYSKI